MFREIVSDNRKEKVFLIKGLVEVRVPLDYYEKASKRKSDEYIISYAERKKILNHVTGRNLAFITRESGIPLLGSAAFGLIDRGTNLIQVRPVTGCNMNCVYCSVDEGKSSKNLCTDYVVEPQYLIDGLKDIAKLKGKGLEAHIDGQGEPLLYPYLEELLEGISKIKEVEVISIQTNGTLLTEELISFLGKYVTRVNLSLSSFEKRTARRIHRINYPVNNIVQSIKEIVESKMDLLIAPLWLPGLNDGEIEKIIEFAIDVGAGKKYPPLGIQKYIPYKYGRKLKKTHTFGNFYSKLAELENKYNIKLILSPEDFGMEKRQKTKHPIKKGEILKARLVADGRMFNEKLAVVRNRVVTVRTQKKVGEIAKFKIVRSNDGIFLAS